MAPLAELRLAFNLTSICTCLLYLLCIFTIKGKWEGLHQEMRWADSATAVLPFISFMPMMLTCCAWLSMRRLEEVRSVADDQHQASLKVTVLEALPWIVTTLIHDGSLTMQSRLFWHTDRINKLVQHSILFPVALLVFAMCSLLLIRNTRIALVHREEAISSYLRGECPSPCARRTQHPRWCRGLCEQPRAPCLQDSTDVSS